MTRAMTRGQGHAVGCPAVPKSRPITMGIANTIPEFYKAEKRLIDRYEEFSGGIKADISPDPLPLPQKMSKQKNNYESWITGQWN